MGKRVKIIVWISVLAIGQKMIDSLIFDIPKSIEDNDISYYQPRSELQQNLSELNKHIHEENLVHEISLITGEKTVNDDYMITLREYHSQILGLYTLINSKPVQMSINKMSAHIIKSIKYINSPQCLFVNDSKDTYSRLIETFPSLMESLSKRDDAIYDIHKRISNVKPEFDENGKQDAEALIERVDILNDLFKNPYLGVREGHFDVINEIDLFLLEFDNLHAIYMNCAESFNSEVKESNEYKKYISFIFFLIITLLIYHKEILNK